MCHSPDAHWLHPPWSACKLRMVDAFLWSFLWPRNLFPAHHILASKNNRRACLQPWLDRPRMLIWLVENSPDSQLLTTKPSGMFGAYRRVGGSFCHLVSSYSQLSFHPTTPVDRTKCNLDINRATISIPLLGHVKDEGENDEKMSKHPKTK
jgi:hypothetical protein